MKCTFTVAFVVILLGIAAGAQAATISPGGAGTLGTVSYVSGNLALSGTASQSSDAFGTVAADANDNNTDGNFGAGSTTHTNTAVGEFWRVDFAGTNEFALSNVVVFNRSDCCGDRLSEFNINVLNSATGVIVNTAFDLGNPGNGNTGQGVPNAGGVQSLPGQGLNHVLANNTVADAVQVVQNANFPLSLAEVQAFGDPSLELSGDTIEIEVSSLGNDFVDVEGAATLDGTINVSDLDGSLEPGDILNILNAASIDASGLTITGGRFGFNILNNEDESQTLQLFLVPEPRSIAIWALGALVMALAVWRLPRRRK